MKKIILLIIISSFFLFTSCQNTSDDSEVVLPDIVFVKFCWDYEYEITGECIDKDGYVRQFIFTQGEWKDNSNYWNDHINEVKRMNQYTDVRNVKTVNDMITQHYKESDDSDVVRKVDMKELSGYYNELLQVNINKKMTVEGYSNLSVIDEWACMYGIRKNGDGTDEIVFIREYQTAYLTTKEKNANNLFTELGNIFSGMDKVPLYGW